MNVNKSQMYLCRCNVCHKSDYWIPAMALNTLHGSCACKAILYEAVKLSTPIQHCHCQTCRKTHAAAFAPTAGVLPADFTWTQGEHRLSQFESSPGKIRYFCSSCGSHLLAKKENRPFWVLRVATLDQAPGGLPECHDSP